MKFVAVYDVSLVITMARSKVFTLLEKSTSLHRGLSTLVLPIADSLTLYNNLNASPTIVSHGTCVGICVSER